MFNYTGCKCPVCQQLFNETDDVVVCPECGAPYHRECYQKQGGCLFSDRHGAGFEWKPGPGEGPVAPQPAPNQTPDGEEQACAACGAMNPTGGLFCESCGAPLRRGTPRYDSTSGQVNPAAYSANSVPQQDPFNMQNLPPELRVSPDEELEGVSARHWAAFLGRSAPYYLFNFKRMSLTGQKITACFSAFFFGPFYFFYRKMWSLAALFTTMNVIFMVPTLLNTLILLESPVAAAFGASAALISTLAKVCSSLGLFVQFIQGSFAVYWYKRSSKKRIEMILASEQPNTDTLLARKGGVSVAALVICVLAYVAASYLLAFFAFPDIWAAALAL